jgi:hypothetical protein
MRFGSDNDGRSVRLATLLGIVFMVFVLPATLVAVFHASVVVVISGGVAWALAQVIKVPAYLTASRLLRKRLRLLEWAAVRGLVSALSELALSAIYLAYFLPMWSGQNVIAFGVGVSSAEILFLLMIIIIHRLAHRSQTKDDRPSMAPKGPLCIRYSFLIERFGALTLHVGSRCLVFISLWQHEAWVGIWALVSFTLVDSLAAYGKLRNWNWLDPHICRRFYGIVLSVGASDLVLFALMACRFNQ